jgi:PIN domain nuclease of toxin-antitoxin system
MKYLLDTNIFIFLITEELEQLSLGQKEILDDLKNDLYLSEAYYYEISIKVRLEKLNFSHIDVNKLEVERKRFGIHLLKSKPEYYINIPNMAKVYISETKLHVDPFDLLIISQATFENLPILSSDKLFPEYQGLITIT